MKVKSTSALKFIAVTLLLLISVGFQNCGKPANLSQTEEEAALGSISPENPQIEIEPEIQKRLTVLASSFKDKSDIAPELQTAIDDPNTANIIFDGSLSTTYFSSKIRLRSNLKFIFDKDVTLRAKIGGFQGAYASFFTGTRVSNIAFEGAPGAKILMNKSEYFGAGIGAHDSYSVRSSFAFYSAQGITIRNLHIADSGGDGIYLGDASSDHKLPCKDITIDSVVLDNHARNAMSVISVDGLYIKNTIFSNTKNPEAFVEEPFAGIDFEPNYATQVFHNIEVVDSTFHSNAGEAVDFHFAHLTDATNNTVSIRFARTRIYNSDWGFKLLNGASVKYKGLIEVLGVCSDRPTVSRAVYMTTAAPGTLVTSDVRLNCSGF